MSFHYDRPLAVVADDPLGIGFELARRFAVDGYDLLIAAEEARHGEFETELEPYGARVDCVDADPATPDGILKLVATIHASPTAPDAIALGGGAGEAACISATRLWDVTHQAAEQQTSAAVSAGAGASGRTRRAAP